MKTIEKTTETGEKTSAWEKPGELERHPESLFRVQFEDCDPFGHLNNGRYLSYALNAREVHL